MSGVHLALAARIRQEVDSLNLVVARAERAAERMRGQPDPLWADAAALNLHDFYAGLERLFRLIASQVDGSVPSGQEWHRDWLRQMGLFLKRVRPAVLSPETVKRLDEYLRFRHVVRNVYALELDPERLLPLVHHLRPVFGLVRQDLLEFAFFLEDACGPNGLEVQG
ncbi:MAG: hypothetical protein HPY83_00325 [Anaerolineae bacterium]|nr:hypothetical protein [Anaerolineae bacterium]